MTNRYTPIPETDFFDSIFQPIYEQDAAYHGTTGSHSLAVLYMILAIGTLLDLDGPAHSPESKQYYQLGRAALALDSVIEEQSIPGIQALVKSPYILTYFIFAYQLFVAAHVSFHVLVRYGRAEVGHHGYGGKNGTKCQSSLFLYLIFCADTTITTDWAT